MTDKELRRMSRARLIDLLIEQTERNNQLQARLERLEKQVKNNTITISSTGSIADAAQELNRVLTSADRGGEASSDVIAPDRHYEELIAEAKRRAVENREPDEAVLETRAQTPAKEKSVRYRDPEPPARAKKPAQKSGAARRSESTSKKTRARTPDPFDEVPLDDYMNKAFSQMRKRNSH